MTTDNTYPWTVETKLREGAHLRLMSFRLSGLWSKYWFALVHDQPISPPSET